MYVWINIHVSEKLFQTIGSSISRPVIRYTFCHRVMKANANLQEEHFFFSLTFLVMML